MKLLNNKKIGAVLSAIIIIVLNIIVFNLVQYESKVELVLQYCVKSNKEDSFQLFYSNNMEWAEEQSMRVAYTKVNQKQKIEYKIPEFVSKVRLDFGEQAGKIKISEVGIKSKNGKVEINNNILVDADKYANIQSINQEKDEIIIDRATNDAFVIIDLSTLDLAKLYDDTFSYVLKILVCIIMDCVILILLKKKGNIKTLLSELYANRRLIWNLSKNDFSTKYAGSYLGVVWAFVQPIVTILVYWFVFQVGFKSAPMQDFPFTLWLIAGMVPWFFFLDSIMNATNSMLEYSYLVKKVVFKISILPIIKIISALFVHIFFIGFTLLLYVIYGYGIDIYTLQLVYYSFCVAMLVLGLSYITSSLVIFFRDLGQIINILLQVGVWMTPIMWPYTMIDERHRWILKLNPMYYVVEGYRDSLINKIWFWERFNQTVYFWVITGIAFATGTIIFKKLKVHFADVL